MSCELVVECLEIVHHQDHDAGMYSKTQRRKFAVSLDLVMECHGVVVHHQDQASCS